MLSSSGSCALVPVLVRFRYYWKAYFCSISVVVSRHCFLGDYGLINFLSMEADVCICLYIVTTLISLRCNFVYYGNKSCILDGGSVLELKRKSVNDP